ncbi:MAG: hypothetical protein Sv326_0268 [Candidatus Fermentimicrarchaeum limneticum]|uniref:Uncharacterized protein n=1 Tax=Fermentimicrarchaeum limneticum TaxID=2795018 RepID=A0A7D6BQ35_FERL1|nr:MAG: hypothetical protein Sv326_0268 [Candidatus Fermentimicrarchaeum limneticum]
MRPPVIFAVVFSLLLLGCYSTQNLGGGGEAPLITDSKNFTMKEGWQENFRLTVGESVETHKISVTSVAPKAAMLKIDSKPVLLHITETSQVSLSGKTVFVTLNEVSEGYARFSISLSQPGTSQPPSGPSAKTQNGGKCSVDSDCQSSHCSNGYCCASGSCCLSDSNCSIGRCNTTTYACFTPTALSNGAPCNSNADCQSNHCNNSFCCASGKCCLSNSNCASGEVCNTTLFSCAQQGSGYTSLAAEQKANSTTNGTLMSRFSSIFDSARQCTGGNESYKQCVPNVATRTEKTSASVFRVTYSYSLTGTSCCPTSDILIITVDLSTNTTTTQRLDTSQTSTLADTMNLSLQSGCASALQYIAQVRGLACPS